MKGRICFTIPNPGKMKDFSKLYGLNSIYSGKHWSQRKADSDYWHAVVHYQLMNQLPDAEMFESPVCIIFSWNDRLDCSNHAYLGKMIEDAMKGILIRDDSRKYVQEIRHRFHEEPYILVEVKEEKEK